MPTPTDLLADPRAAVRVHGLTRRFGDRVAVRDVSFSLLRGEIVGLLGRYGAGKTTTLRLLAGALLPDAGQVIVDGFDVHAQPQRAKPRVGWLAEGAPAHEEMRVEAYLRFRGRLRGLSGAALTRSVGRELERCGLTMERRTVIAHLSRGYRQRVGLADALLAEPSVLLLDEPTSGLDPTQLRGLRALITSMKDERTLVLSSHALAEVQALCDRVLVLREGALVADDTPHGLGQAHPQGAFVIEASGGATLLAVLEEVLRTLDPGATLRPQGTLQPGGAVVAAVVGTRVVVVPSKSDALRPACAQAICNAGLSLQHLAPVSTPLESAMASLLEPPT